MSGRKLLDPATYMYLSKGFHEALYKKYKVNNVCFLPCIPSFKDTSQIPNPPMRIGMAIKKIMMSKNVSLLWELTNTPFIYNCAEICSLLLIEINIGVFNGGIIDLSLLKMQLEILL